MCTSMAPRPCHTMVFLYKLPSPCEEVVRSAWETTGLIASFRTKSTGKGLVGPGWSLGWFFAAFLVEILKHFKNLDWTWLNHDSTILDLHGLTFAKGLGWLPSSDSARHMESGEWDGGSCPSFRQKERQKPTTKPLQRLRKQKRRLKSQQRRSQKQGCRVRSRLSEECM